MSVHAIDILLLGGKGLWEEDNSLNIDTDILNPNDLYRKGSLITLESGTKKIILCEVDTEKTKMNEFYRWKDLDIHDEDTFCWRTYIHLLGSTDSCWLNIPKNEKLGSISVHSLIQSIVVKSSKP